MVTLTSKDKRQFVPGGGDYLSVGLSVSAWPGSAFLALLCSVSVLLPSCRKCTGGI